MRSMISCSRSTAHMNVKPARGADYGIGGAGFVYASGSLGNAESGENGRSKPMFASPSTRGSGAAYSIEAPSKIRANVL